MKQFPQYHDQVNVDRRKRQVRADLVCGTRCGPELTASHTVRLLTLNAVEVSSAITLAIQMAWHELDRQHAQVVARCCRAKCAH